MAKRRWLKTIRRRLLAEGLPPAYVRRLTDELADHFDDIQEDTMRKDAEVTSRVGRANQLADAAAAAFRRRTFVGRHPFWVFGVSPVIAMLSAFVAACLGVAAVGASLERCGVPLSGRSWLGGVDPAALSWTFAVVTTIAPAVLLTFFYCRAARRSAVRRGWPLASCIAVACVAMLPFQRFLHSDLPGQSVWTIGLGLPPSGMQCVQLLIPLAIGLWLMARGRVDAMAFQSVREVNSP